MIYKNTASQKLAVYAYTASTGASKTGDAAQITCYLSIDWAAGAAVTDTNPTELDDTHMPGWYLFDLTQAETNGNVLVFAPVSSTAGVVLDQVQVFTTASVDQTGDSYARLGAPAGASVSADIAVIEGYTDDIGAAGVGLSAIPWNAAWDAEVESEVDDALGAGTGTSLTAIPWNAAWDAEVESEVDDALGAGTGTSLTAIPWNAAWDAEVESECDDALVAFGLPTDISIADAVWDEASAHHVAAGSTGKVIADVLVDTAEIGTAGAGLTNINLPDQTMAITGNITGNLSGSVGSVGAGGITAASFAAGAVDAAALSDDAVDAILDEVVEGAYTMRDMLQLMAAALFGKASGGGTATITFRDTGDSADRIVATVDANGNRTAVTLTA